MGPFRLAAMLRRPVILMMGIYRGGSRYDIHFEQLADFSERGAARSGSGIDAAMQAYVSRLEHYSRLAPYNWFNFYDFWS